jgi:hypothetical protein
MKSSFSSNLLRALRVLRGFDFKMLAKKTRCCAFAVQGQVCLRMIFCLETAYTAHAMRGPRGTSGRNRMPLLWLQLGHET